MMKVKVLLMKAPYILFIFQLDSIWYGLSKEVRRNKRIRRVWSVKRILGREKMSVGISDKRLDIVLTDFIKEDTIWQTEVEMRALDLWRTISDYNTASLFLKDKLMHKSTREGNE
jgi:hypothetical protein